MSGLCIGDTLTVEIASLASENKGLIRVELGRDKSMKVISAAGEKLQVEGKVEPHSKRPEFDFEVSIPYSTAKGKAPSINGAEMGKYRLKINNSASDFMLANLETEVGWWLKFELAGGLRTWEAIFAEKGYIPTGLGAGADWDRFSDTGGYAHLIAACAQWLIYQGGKRDWELMKVPAVK